MPTMDCFNDYKPAMALFALQFTYAGVALSTRAALLQGMSPRAFVFYRQAIATLVTAPIAYFTRYTRKTTTRCSMGPRSFGWEFLASLVGVAINQNIYFEGLYLASSSMASAMANLIPAITFLIASILGLEKVNIRSLRSIAKISGTVLCVGGAVSMALLRGPKLLNSELLPRRSMFSLGGENWLLGCLFLFGSTCCWSMWLILQVPLSASYPDHLSQSSWMCFLATIQSGTITLLLERDWEAWKLHSFVELACCFYSGIVGSGLSFFVQSWCISQRGPVFSAMFNPLCTVIVTIFASIFPHEEVYTGSLAGAFGVIAGLYIVLWGKVEDLEDSNEKRDVKLHDDQTRAVIDECSEKKSCKIDLEEPLLSDHISTELDKTHMGH